MFFFFANDIAHLFSSNNLQANIRNKYTGTDIDQRIDPAGFLWAPD